MPFREDCFDTTLACEILEHFQRWEGSAILKELERVSRDAIILSTPFGFLKQGTVQGNPYQKHLSAWFPKDFEHIGYSHRVIIDLYIPRRVELLLKKIIQAFPSLPFFKEIVVWKIRRRDPSLTLLPSLVSHVSA